MTDEVKDLQRRMNEAEKQTALAQQSINLMAENLKLMRKSLEELTKQNATLELLKHRVDHLDKVQIDLRIRLKSVQESLVRTDGAKAGANWMITMLPKVGQVLLWLIVGMLALSSFGPSGGKGG
ncbi:hypothetical protein [Shewanella xiamenensis]|uniref:hypothetical protein n=1 Tax=Shewanella xiamenensis TaxID=332186 RepID=UPI000849DC52|nr:hypothetical protein [Shewanella xiamenensis]ODR86733.1 hypothetical protein ABT47_16190 [Shewanella xiamenensis]